MAKSTRRPIQDREQLKKLRKEKPDATPPPNPPVDNAAASKPVVARPSKVLPSGPIKSKAPRGEPWGVNWEAITRWHDLVMAAVAVYPTVPWQLVYMVILIESRGKHYDDRGRVITRDDGFGDGLSVGLMQPKPNIHQWRVPGVDAYTPEGNIMMGTAVLAAGIEKHGNWKSGFLGLYFPTDDPNGTTQQAYVRAIEQGWAEIDGAAPAPEVDPMAIIVGGIEFDDRYGWLSRANIDYSNYATGHGTTHWDEHPGIDLAIPVGTPLYSPGAGVVACVGNKGTPQPGRACGSYGDDRGGPGNITIRFDKVWLTLGHCRSALVTPGQLVTAGQQVGTSGSSNGPHVHVETSILKGGTYLIVEPREALREIVRGTVVKPADPRDGLVAHELAGTSRKLYLPSDVKFLKDLTPKGPNRQGLSLTPKGVVYHQTGNRGIGTGAEHHARWQRNGTQGHPNNKPGGPNIGVHFYVDDKAVVQTLPVNEQGIHSGDSRNQTHLAVEECINADRNSAQAERNTAYLHSSLLRDVIGNQETVPHSCNHCPTLVCNRWPTVKSRIVNLIGGGGSVVAPKPVYASVKPINIEWDGEDKIVNGIHLIALNRNFRAAVDQVPALQYADPDAAAVRAPLPKGEGFTGMWMVKGEDGKPWIITKYWSRIPADQCIPQVKLEDSPIEGITVITTEVLEKI